MGIKIFDQEASFFMIWKLKGSILRTVLSARKISNLVKVHASMLLKKEMNWGVPYSILLEPTSKCNLKCPMCARTIYPEIISMRNNMDMPFPNFKKLMDEVGDRVMFLFLWNFGEPLINPDIFRMIEYAKKKKIFTLMSTNAYLLDSERAKKLIVSGLDYLIISFDGASKESYEQYRKNSDFSRVTGNIENFVKMKKAEGKALPFTNLQFILMKHNAGEVQEIRKLAAKLGVDRTSFKKTIIYDDNLKDSLLPEDSKYKFNFYNKSGGEKIGCERPWVHMVVNCEGAVLPCCDDIKYSHYMGNALESGVKVIINNDKYTAFRKQVVDDIRKIDICKNCPRRLNELTLIG
ncbi:MAG: radical SAM protein [Candidatus Aenigmatarchaeota archaeon]